jgi:hypothetical protein
MTLEEAKKFLRGSVRAEYNAHGRTTMTWWRKGTVNQMSGAPGTRNVNVLASGDDRKVYVFGYEPGERMVTFDVKGDVAALQKCGERRQMDAR